MKIKRLRLAGFGPFKNEQFVDFEGFDADGIFLIAGKTGAGKSSILDAVCFALYGSVPRYEDAESRLRSDYCEAGDPTFVELEFGLDGQDYRIYRTPAYLKAKKRGVGTTPAKPEARLELRESRAEGDRATGGRAAGDRAGGDDGWRAVAARPVDVGTELSRILPLRQDQFLQVILLAQNRFQRFLLARTDGRREVLRTLFGTSRFQGLETELLARVASLDGQFAAVRLGLGGLAATVARHAQRTEVPESPGPDWFAGALADLDHSFAVALEAAGAADGVFLLAGETFRAQEDVRRRQLRRDAAAATLATLESSAGAVDGRRASVSAANRAARVWPQVEAREAAAGALESARAAEQRARHAWHEVRPFDARAAAGPRLHPGQLHPADAPPGSGDDAEDRLGAAVDLLLEQLGSLGDVLDAERSLHGLDEDLVRAETELVETTAAVTTTQERLAGLPTRLDDTERRLADAVLAAAREPEARAALARSLAARAAAVDADRLEVDVADAHRRDSEAAAANTAAAGSYQDLVARRLAGHAGELAGALVPGEPCGVCGSTEHPAPAAVEARPVTEADVDAALARVRRAQRALDDCHDATVRLGSRLAEARAIAGPGTVDEHEADAAASTASVEAAAVAARLADELGAATIGLRAELEDTRLGLDSLRSARETASTRVTECRGRVEAIVARVRLHRGDFPTVTDRAARLRAELDAARTLASALALSAERERAGVLATAAVGALLAVEGFADEAGARLARLSPAEMADGEADIRRHDDELAATRAVLLEPALAALPGGVVDPEPARVALAAASDARDAALATRSALSERVVELTALVAEADALLADSTALGRTQAQVRELASAVHGQEPNTKRMNLETYVLAAQLEEIITAANGRLRTMTGGRYTLEHDDSLQFRGTQSGLGLAILDQHTGRARPTHSLSGGETFLASLALALGLAEVVSNQAGGIALDTLFVDEGFGSLDSETLETAMSTLDGLRAGGRTIGLISHVDSMKEQIPAKLSIVVTDQGYSEIEDIEVAPA